MGTLFDTLNTVFPKGAPTQSVRKHGDPQGFKVKTGSFFEKEQVALKEHKNLRLG